MRRNVTIIPVLVVLVLGSLVAGLPPAAAVQESGEAHVLRINEGDSTPETLDPQLSHMGQWGLSGSLDYEGLTHIDEELNPVPAAAESWQFSPDGKNLTFHLRDGLVFSDGVPVTAAHFVYAAQRLCGPELNSESAIELFDAVGCEELFTSRDAASGTTAADDAAAAAEANLGVRALDDRTVEYRFDKPVPYFPVTAAIWGTIPLRQDLIEAGGPEWWANPETRIGNGPFRLVTYEPEEPDQILVYARNDRYWGGPTKLDRLEFHFADLNDFPATMEAYRNGEYDITYFDDRFMTELESDPVLSREIVTMPEAGTLYYAFNLTREPFQDEKVREAFAYAFDRESYCQQIENGFCKPNLGWVPPGAPGYIETDAFAFDPVKAREALAASSYGGPENLPEITWYNVAGEPSRPMRGAWLSALFHDVLGVELNQETIPEEDEYYALYDDLATSPQFHQSGWWAGPDVRGWFIVWRCGSEFNEGYCNPEYDALVDRADAELDPAKRLALYEEAGRVLVADAPAIFVHNASTFVLVKPYVVGYSRTTPNDFWPGWTNLMTVDVVRPA